MRLMLRPLSIVKLARQQSRVRRLGAVQIAAQLLRFDSNHMGGICDETAQRSGSH